MFPCKALTVVFLLTATVKSDVDPETLSVREQKAIAIIKSLETGDPHGFDIINPYKYIQHNAGVADGLAGIVDLQKAGLGSTKVNTIRVIEDGDFVTAHTDYFFGGAPMVGFDVWRYENGLVVEHWDNLQVKPNGTNPSGHTMLDGPTQVTDLDKTQFNKALVSSYSNTLVTPPWNSSIIDVNYIQHNPLLGDGLQGLIDGLKQLAANGKTVTYTSIFKVLAQGNFVLTMALGTFGPDPVAFYDLYRLDSGKIVEHWDNIQTIPPRSEWKNNNDKF